MLRRSSKRRIKKYISIIILLLFLTGFGAFVYTQAYRFPKFSVSQNNSNIVKPYVANSSVFDISNALKEKKIEVRSIKMLDDSSGINADLNDGVSVIFSTEKDAKNQVSSLQEIMNRLTIDNKKPKKIDFRYSKPIVNF